MNADVLARYEASLISFFNEYKKLIRGEYPVGDRDNLVNKLERETVYISKIVWEVHGGGGMILGKNSYTFQQALNYFLTDTVPNGYDDFVSSHISLTLNQAIGNIRNQTIPVKKISPVLPLKDVELKNRCLELLSKPGHFDTAVREATLVLEARLKNSVPNEILAGLIPSTANINFENLVNNLLAPSNPVLIISTDVKERVAFHKIMLGVGAYLRNPFHHNIDDQMEWSWAWSIVGFIDHLLFELGKCEKQD